MMPGLSGFVAAVASGAVSLADFTDVEVQHPPSDASTFYQLRSDGKINVSDGTGSAILGDWLLSGAAADYEAKMTVESGAFSAGSGPVGTWVNPPTEMWRLDRTSLGTSHVVAKLQLRRKADGVVLAEAAIDLTSTKEASS